MAELDWDISFRNINYKIRNFPKINLNISPIYTQMVEHLNLNLLNFFFNINFNLFFIKFVYFFKNKKIK